MTIYVRKIGTRFLDADKLVHVLVVANQKFQHAKQLGYEYMNMRIENYQNEFFGMLSNLKKRKKY